MAARADRELKQNVEAELRCHPQIPFDALVITDITDGRGDQQPLGRTDRAQADLDRELAAIEAPPQERKPLAHGARPQRLGIFAPVDDVPAAETLRHELLDGHADHRVVAVAEEHRHLAVGKANDAAGIDDDHRIGCGIEDAAGKFGGKGLHMAMVAACRRQLLHANGSRERGRNCGNYL